MNHEASENKIVLGCLGALLGAVLGGAAIVLLRQGGAAMGISGIILAATVLYGYELCGKGLTKVGLGVCLGLLAITPFLANWIGWAIDITNNYPDISFWKAFSGVREVISHHSIFPIYIQDLLFLYAFVAVGAFAILRPFFKKRRGF